MRLRIAALLLVSSLFVPSVAFAGIPFFGPIIPAAYNVCPAAWAMLIQVINNIISFLLTFAIVFFAPIMIAWAGFLYVVNPFDPGGMARAKTILLNTLIGIVIALASYMIVAAVMAVLYKPSAFFPAWQSIIRGDLGEVCLKQAGSLPSQGNNQPPITGVGSGGLNRPPANKSGTACDPSVVKASAAAGGYPNLTDLQANIFGCIAQWESSCGTSNLPPKDPNYRWNKGVPGNPGSSAAGAFQVLLSTHHQCYEKSVCYSAAGVTGPLNCHNAFDNVGNPRADRQQLVDTCLRAANNLTCSVTAASCLLEKRGGIFSDWQADVNSAKQTGCITSGG